jgi:excinuclease ABC subunit C
MSEVSGADIPLVSLAKKDEEVFIPGRLESLRLPRRSPALRLLQQARDEAHRFAITFNRTRRKARTVTSRLLELPGIGPKKRRALLTAFGSLEGVRGASPEAIAAVPGFSVASATRLLDQLREPAVGSSSQGILSSPNDSPTSES